MPRSPVAPVVRIRPAWWSPRVWPLIVVALGAHAALVGGLMWSEMVFDDVPWGWLLVMWVIVGISLGIPIVELRPRRIEVSPWVKEDDTELGGLHSGGAGGRSDWAKVVVNAAEIRDWRREAMSIRLLVGGPPSRTVRFSIRGMREADRVRIIAWLTEKVGG
ncbi:MAG TPA: hypothetical protein VFS92_09160 [Planctomycetota bacterium]|nr:hypothetical protein [Planctomycetota bacterium]